MTIYEVPECSDSLLQTILTIWEASVRATHHFLSDAEIVRIREYVPQAVRAVEHLVLAEDASGTAVAFLGAEGHRLEMLFLSRTGERHWQTAAAIRSPALRNPRSYRQRTESAGSGIL